MNTIRTADQTSDLHDPKVDEKVVLSGLWMSMLFVFAYVDIFDFSGPTSSMAPSPARSPIRDSRSTRHY